MKISMTLAGVAAAILVATAANAADPADKCEAHKSKAAGKYYACRQKAESVAILKGGSPDYSKCSAKFDEKWNVAETAGAGTCPDNVPTADVNAYLASQAAKAAAIIAGESGVPICGDGLINEVGEHCDGDSLGGVSCAELGLAGDLACSPDCKFDVGGCQPCPGFVFGGACWVMSGVSSDCDTACSGVGLVYDTATASIAGSGGTDSACEAILTGLGLPGTVLDFPSSDCPVGVGCGFTFLSDRIRCASPETLSTAATLGVARTCACR